jgi:hypothetical protein
MALPAAAQTLLGTVTGVVKDEQGGAIPGALVSLVGKTGTKTATSGSDGSYRFLAVEPGTYTVQAQMPDFASRKRDDVVVTIGKQALVDFTLKIGGMSDTTTVIGDAPVVDVSSSSTNNQLSQDLLFNMPIRPVNAATGMLNFAPGINGQSAYGGDASSANALLIDGVDTRDPSGGTAWTFFNYDLVQEVQLIGIGAPAEYGAFTGASVNTLTKSGGNRFSGLFNALYTKSSLASSNLTSAITDANPALAQPAKVINQTDLTAQLGGPIMQDKLFFFLSAERFHRRQDPSGPITAADEVSPRINGKLTWQPSANDTVSASLQYDNYNIIGRAGPPALLASDETTNREDAPEYVWNTSYRHLFGSKTFVEVKYTGWWGFYDLNPEVTRPGRLDDNGAYTVSQGWFYYADRSRHQVNASVSHFAEAYGKHDLKFGVEVERSKTRDRYGYVDNIFYYDVGGKPYQAYSYGYDLNGRNKRESLYVQDSWKVGDRVTLNPGLRLDFVGGGNPDTGTLYSATNLAPRLGMAVDLTGDHKTVLKGSYSRYYDGIFNDMYKAATPGIADKVTYDVSACPSIAAPCPPSLRVEVGRTTSTVAHVDPNIKHPNVDEVSLGLERAVGNDIRVSVTGLWRKNNNFIGTVLPDARWQPITLTSTATPAVPATTIPGYRWTNKSASDQNRLITNPDGFQFRDPSGNVIGTIDAKRTYKALIAVVSKRFSQRWQAQVSYVFSKADGTRDNTGEGQINASTSFYQTPSLALSPFTNGTLTNSRTHELKVLLGYQVPVLELAVNAYYRSISGTTYTPFQQFSSTPFGGSSNTLASDWRQLLLEPRGTLRLPMNNLLDLRLEKIFNVGAQKDRLALYADISNVFNASLITGIQNRVPNRTLAGVPNPVLFGSPTGVVAPRQTVLGARWAF